LIPGGKLTILVASPECTHHSIARGGKPRNNQSRASAWHVLHWAERLQIENILIENVKEFRSWGPLTKKGMPHKRMKGKTFDAFLTALRSLGYTVDHRVLNAADYGDATSRRRLFIQACRKGTPTWPEASHVGRWKAAREIIDWDFKGESIFNRRRPLAPRTLDRIESGLRKFGGEPFIAILRGTTESHREAWAKPVSDPLQTICASGLHSALCEPFLVEYHGEKRKGEARVVSVGKPLPVQTTENRFGLCEPFIVQVAHEGSNETRVRSIDKPLPTIPAGHRGEIAMVEPFIAKYYGNGDGARPVGQPLDTITARDRFALVEPRGMDIRFRMLQPRELAAAMGFDGYEFAGTKTDQVRQIGNAVAVRTAEALCGAIIDAKAGDSK
jgi:DNA (cytosine-5)-methyltransferase 1